MQAQNQPELTMNAEALYREESFTDRKVGLLRRLTPVTIEGDTDSTRSTIYLGQTQILTAMGPVPLNFDIQADSLKSAIEQFADAANQAIEKAMREVQDMRRDAASSIVVPGVNDMPGGGKIKLT